MTSCSLLVVMQGMEEEGSEELAPPSPHQDGGGEYDNHDNTPILNCAVHTGHMTWKFVSSTGSEVAGGYLV